MLEDAEEEEKLDGEKKKMTKNEKRNEMKKSLVCVIIPILG